MPQEPCPPTVVRLQKKNCILDSPIRPVNQFPKAFVVKKLTRISATQSSHFISLHVILKLNIYFAEYKVIA